MSGGLENARGKDTGELSVPPLDGPFRPNSAVEDASVVLERFEPDNLAMAGDGMFMSSGGDLLRLEAGTATAVSTAAAPITAIAGRSDGALAIARSGGTLTIREGDTGRDLKLDGEMRGDITAMAFVGSGQLAITIGAQGRPASDWKRDLMEHGSTGSLWLVDVAKGGSKRLAGSLRYPAGLCVTPGGKLLVSLSWDHTLAQFDLAGAGEMVLANLPGYPWRIAAAAGGGYWLCFASVRNQLVEFVLREGPFRREMIRTISPDHWVAPALGRHISPLDPTQEGGQKVAGTIKPWAPSFSYGLLAHLDAAFLPQDSFHSRADGRRHGITSAVQQGDRLLATSRGGGVVVEFALQRDKTDVG